MSKCPIFAGKGLSTPSPLMPLRPILLFSFCLAACLAATCLYGQDHTIDLRGTWEFALDARDAGISQRWFAHALTGRVLLPGTLDENHQGMLNRDSTTMHLNRVYVFTGAAWYRRRVTVPAGWTGSHVRLLLERTKVTDVWIDSSYAGGSILLGSVQSFDLSRWLTPGPHTITIRVDNDPRFTPYGNVHAYSDDTQTNWNGILGSLLLQATPATYINGLRVDPDIEGRRVTVRMAIADPVRGEAVDVQLWVTRTEDGRSVRLPSLRVRQPCADSLTLVYAMDTACRLWDEYRQPLYHLTAVIATAAGRDTARTVFGMRRFSVRGTQFAINGRTVFLRGKHDGGVFPLTGHPPMDVEGWKRVFRIARSYGINHYRFHSYCPPEAAFTAADETGIYIQAELPFWGGLDNDTTAMMLREEGMAMLRAYGNHPSFVLFSAGNEIWGGFDRVEKNIAALKAFDDRPLYTTGSNNGIGYTPPGAVSDYFVGARVPPPPDTMIRHTRLTHAFADSREGGTLNGRLPSTEVDFSLPVRSLSIPLVSHEVGQYQVYPDYQEINKYRGVLRATNLVIFRRRLSAAGMADLDSVFHKASGAWSALCYKAEMEAALKTRGMAGFQLLDLQDYPGQGTALIGMLDAFMDDKRVVSRKDWLASCNDVVLMAAFSKYCWTNTETFQARIVVANYSDHAVDGVAWSIRDSRGRLMARGRSALKVVTGSDSVVGEVRMPLDRVQASEPVRASEREGASDRTRGSERLTLRLRTGDGRYENSYPIWVYPADAALPDARGIVVTDTLTEAVVRQLQGGAKVLLFPSGSAVKGHSVDGLFPPDFWNYGMFKGISEHVRMPVSPGTLGLLMDPHHPVFRYFPTDFHTNWQWFSIVKAGHPLILDAVPGTYRPIVQVIDNLERDHKLGLLFEWRVGAGRLLVCMTPLLQLRERPEARQLYRGIVEYMESGAFRPAAAVSVEDLQRLLGK